MTELVTQEEVKKLAECLVGKTIRLITMNNDKSIIYFQQLDAPNNYVVLGAEDNTKMTVNNITMTSGNLSKFYESPIVAVDYSRVTVDGEDMDIYTLTTENQSTLVIKCDIRYSAFDTTPIEREYTMEWRLN